MAVTLKFREMLAFTNTMERLRVKAFHLTPAVMGPVFKAPDPSAPQVWLEVWAPASVPSLDAPDMLVTLGVSVHMRIARRV